MLSQDFLVDNNTSLPSFDLKTFASKVFSHCALLKPLQEKCHIFYDDFNNYKYQIPVYGCIMMDATLTQVVLVRSWKGNSWSFPKGKINEFEDEYDCAMRECFEETGFNPSEHCSPDDFVVVHEKNKVTKLYIASGVPKITVFIPQTRKEISKVDFFPLDCLPKRVWGVHPFLPTLSRWISKQLKNKGKIKVLRSKPDAIGASDANGPHEDSGIGVAGEREADPQLSSKGKKKKKILQQSFDRRNADTFGSEEEEGGGGRGWSVSDMFEANSKLTGSTYDYDGNPHNFGSTHPKYRNYASMHVASEGGGVSVEVEGSVAQESSEHCNVSSSNTNARTLCSTDSITVPLFFPSNFQFDALHVMKALNSALGAV